MSSGLSDFHELVFTVMKTIFPKAKPNEIFYRNYKNFNETIFKDDLTRSLRSPNIFVLFSACPVVRIYSGSAQR